jgi:hypothetical protein
LKWGRKRKGEDGIGNGKNGDGAGEEGEMEELKMEREGSEGKGVIPATRKFWICH